MLAYYLTQTERLLQNPAATNALYQQSDLTSYINTARGQVAGEGECIRFIGTLQTVPGMRAYPFSAIVIGTPSLTGIQAPIHVRRISYNVGTGQQQVYPSAWEWFDSYHLMNPNPVAGPPQVWAQHRQGSAGTGAITGIGTGSLISGSFYIDPPPDIAYTLNCDCVCYPQALAADGDLEAIPYLWTDSVPFFAAYYALLSAQNNARLADAERYFNYYQTFVDRARRFSNPSLNRSLYEQAANLAEPASFGLSPKGGGG